MSEEGDAGRIVYTKWFPRACNGRDSSGPQGGLLPRFEVEPLAFYWLVTRPSSSDEADADLESDES